MTDPRPDASPPIDEDRLDFGRRGLARSALFRELSTERLDAVARSLHTDRFQKGDRIFSQGDTGDALYLVESGIVKITAESLDGREAIIGEVREGETFGELVLIDGAPRSASATAVLDTVTRRLSRTAFAELLEADESFRRGVMVALAHELRRATGYLGELHFLDLCGRVASRLAELARDVEPHGEHEIRLAGRNSQSELAAMVGGSRQRVNHHLGELVDEGLIRLDHRDIIVRDIAALERRGEW